MAKIIDATAIAALDLVEREFRCPHGCIVTFDFDVAQLRDMIWVRSADPSGPYQTRVCRVGLTVDSLAWQKVGVQMAAFRKLAEMDAALHEWEADRWT